MTEGQAVLKRTEELQAESYAKGYTNACLDLSLMLVGATKAFRTKTTSTKKIQSAIAGLIRGAKRTIELDNLIPDHV